MGALITGWSTRYGMGSVPMGRSQSLWDGGAHYGMEALPMGRGPSVRVGRGPAGPAAAFNGGSALPALPAAAIASPPLPPVPSRPPRAPMAADGGGWRRMAPAPLHSPWRRPARSSGRDRGREAEVTSAEAAVLRKAGSCGVDDRAGSSASGGGGRAGSGVKRRAPEVDLKGRAPEWRGRQ